MNIITYMIVLYALRICSTEDCKCGPGFLPKTDNNNKTQCHGLLKKIIVPCNMPDEEPCKCTDATSIVYNDDGRWCAKFHIGEEDKKWPCENDKAWSVKLF